MVAAASPTMGEILSAIGVAALYGLSYWRIFKNNPGNRFVECSAITLMVFLFLVPLTMLGAIPDWLFFSWLFLVVLLCFASLFFLFQRILRALRRRNEQSR
jgi:hypothetical protein